jgi:hypothetical protein
MNVHCRLVRNVPESQGAVAEAPKGVGSGTQKVDTRSPLRLV